MSIQRSDRRNISQVEILLILGSLSALGPLSLDMYLPVFPQMAQHLDVPLGMIEATLAIYLFGLAGGQLIYGPLTDRWGRKPIICMGLMVYFGAALLCAVSMSIHAVLIGRLLQSLGACGAMVASRAIVRDFYDKEEAAGVFSKIMLVMGAAPILAPILGGYIGEEFGWRAIFWLLSAFAIFCLSFSFFRLTESYVPSESLHWKQIMSQYWQVLNNRPFLGYCLAGSFAQAGMFAYITGSPYVFIEHFKIPSNQFGYVFGTNALGLVFVSQLNARLLKRLSFRLILQVCLTIVSIVGILLFAAAVYGAGPFVVGPLLFIYIAALGATFPNSTAGALSTQTRFFGSASAVIGTIQMGIAAAASTVVSYLEFSSAVSMTSVMAICGICGILTFLTFVSHWRFSRQ